MDTSKRRNDILYCLSVSNVAQVIPDATHIKFLGRNQEQREKNLVEQDRSPDSRVNTVQGVDLVSISWPKDYWCFIFKAVCRSSLPMFVTMLLGYNCKGSLAPLLHNTIHIYKTLSLASRSSTIFDLTPPPQAH